MKDSKKLQTKREIFYAGIYFTYRYRKDVIRQI